MMGPTQLKITDGVTFVFRYLTETRDWNLNELYQSFLNIEMAQVVEIYEKLQCMGSSSDISSTFKYIPKSIRDSSKLFTDISK